MSNQQQQQQNYRGSANYLDADRGSGATMSGASSASLADSGSGSRSSYNSGQSSAENIYNLPPESVDPSILSRGPIPSSTSSTRRYSRSALIQLRDEPSSRERPQCAGIVQRLMSLGVWKIDQPNYMQQSSFSCNGNGSGAVGGGAGGGGPTNEHRTGRTQMGDGGGRGGVVDRGGGSLVQKTYIDHRSISSAHLMPAFAKRRIVGGNSTSATAPSGTVGKDGNGGGKPDSKDPRERKDSQEILLSPQRNMNMGCQMPPPPSHSARHYVHNAQQRGGGGDRERDREHASNTRERRIGSGRLLPRDVGASGGGGSGGGERSGNWNDYKEPVTDNEGAGSGNTGYNRSHSMMTQGGSSRYEYHRNNSQPEGTGSDYREQRYDRRSYGRGGGGGGGGGFDYDRENSNYMRRYMPDMGSNDGGGRQQRGGGGAGQDHHSGSHHHSGRRRQFSDNRNDEPEWFSGGPTSQHDTIELRGFDEPEESPTTNRRRKISDDSSSGGNAGRNNSKDTLDDILDTETDGQSPPPARSTPTKNYSSDSNNNDEDNADEREGAGGAPQQQHRTDKGDDFNFDAFLNVDTLNNYLGDSKTGEAGGGNSSRFSRWFNKHDERNVGRGGHKGGGGPNNDSRRSSRDLHDEVNNMSINDHKNADKETDKFFAPISPASNHGQPANVGGNQQNNTLMEFLQRGKFNGGAPGGGNPAGQQGGNAASGGGQPTGASGPNAGQDKHKPGAIPSVEELEARMRKNNDMPQQSIHHNKQQQQQQQIQQQQQQQHHHQHFNQLLAGANNQRGAYEHHQQPNQLRPQPHQIIGGRPPSSARIVDGMEAHGGVLMPTDHSPAPPPSTEEDYEQFKKVMEQLGQGVPPPHGQQQQRNAVSAQQMQQMINMQMREQQQQQQMMPQMPPGALQPGVQPVQGKPPTPEEVKKFLMIQQQLQSQANMGVAQICMQPPPQQIPPPHAVYQQNELMSKVIQVQITRELLRKPEAQTILKGLSCGEVTPASLVQQMNHPNISLGTRQVLQAVLQHLATTGSRVPSPNSAAMMAAMVQQQQPPNMTSPIPYQQAMNMPKQPQPPIIGVAQQQQSQKPPQIGGAPNITAGPPQRIPSPRELQYHTQTIMQSALIKKKLEEQQENFRRRQDAIQKMQPGGIMVDQIEMGGPGIIVPQEISSSPQMLKQQQSGHHQMPPQRQMNSPTPLAFTPTSVLRKMTAEKDDNLKGFQMQQQQNNKSMHTLLLQQQQAQSQLANANQQQPPPQSQPRMILGGGSQQQQPMQPAQQQQQQQQAPPQISPHQVMRTNPMKWNQAASANQMNQMPMNKPMGRPILKGGPGPVNQPPQQHQPPVIGAAPGMSMLQQQQQQQQQQQPQQQQQQNMLPPQVTFASKMQQQQNKLIMAQLQQQAEQMLRQRAALQRAHQFQPMQQQFQQQQQQQLQMGNGQNAGQQQANLMETGGNPNPNQSGGGSASANQAGIINYQRDGGLSPTSNQLARWFSPELLAQASAGKLPSLNMGQALSLEEFERSIQHSSAAVHN